jgi:hypothetical protein
MLLHLMIFLTKDVFGPPFFASGSIITTSTDPAPDLQSSIKNSKINLDFYCFVNSL